MDDMGKKFFFYIILVEYCYNYNIFSWCEQEKNIKNKKILLN